MDKDKTIQGFTPKKKLGEWLLSAHLPLIGFRAKLYIA